MRRRRLNKDGDVEVTKAALQSQPGAGRAPRTAAVQQNQVSDPLREDENGDAGCSESVRGST